ncbi:MAG: VCBS repeat-containing protein, partial [Deltaproteobacteria bacterium]
KAGKVPSEAAGSAAAAGAEAGPQAHAAGSAAPNGRQELRPETGSAHEARAPEGALFLALAQFEDGAKPGPAKALIVEARNGRWSVERIEDPDSLVFHKAACFPAKAPEGILTIGGNKALLRLWRRQGDGFRPETLWEASFGGKWDRLRDFEVADVDGDGEDEILIGTHDQGVAAVVEREKGAWKATEIFRQKDTFIHEVEVGDVDGDGKLEFYMTPSKPNKVGVSQPGSILGFRYDPKRHRYDHFWVVQMSDSHAKEILVADVDGDGRDELYAAVEAKLQQKDGKLTTAHPVAVHQYLPQAGGTWKDVVLAEFPGALQARVLLAANLTGSGTELVLTTMRSGIFRLRPTAGGRWEKILVDDSGTGFEHAAGAFDLDGDGRAELYATPDDQDELRRYTWNGAGFDREVIYRLDRRDIVWNITSCGKWIP